MSRCVTQTPVSAGNTEYLTASARWEACKPPYTNTDMKVCVTAAVSILNYLKKSRRTKYERDNFLRPGFSHGGKITIYGGFSEGMQLKGRKPGQWPVKIKVVVKSRISGRLNYRACLYSEIARAAVAGDISECHLLSLIMRLNTLFRG